MVDTLAHRRMRYAYTTPDAQGSGNVGRDGKGGSSCTYHAAIWQHTLQQHIVQLLGQQVDGTVMPAQWEMRRFHGAQGQHSSPAPCHHGLHMVCAWFLLDMPPWLTHGMCMFSGGLLSAIKVYMTIQWALTITMGHGMDHGKSICVRHTQVGGYLMKAKAHPPIGCLRSPG